MGEAFFRWVNWLFLNRTGQYFLEIPTTKKVKIEFGSQVSFG